MLTMKAAVLGHPVSHSLSPTLHNAAYAALGLNHSYQAIDVQQFELESFVQNLDKEWIGLSLTMPLKETPFEFVELISPTARLTKSINTLVLAGEIYADNTDVYGIQSAVMETTDREIGTVTIIGSGATARSSVVAAFNLGAQSVSVISRNEATAQECALIAQELGITFDSDSLLATDWQRSDLVINTTPAGVADVLCESIEKANGLLLDVVYSPWPTRLAQTWQNLGATTCSGHLMLLHQACQQVYLMTGEQAPISSMRAALESALNI